MRVSPKTESAGAVVDALGSAAGARFHQRGVDGEHWIKQMGKSDAVRLRNESELGPVPIEAPGAALLDDLQAGLIVAVEEGIGCPAPRVLVDEL